MDIIKEFVKNNHKSNFTSYSLSSSRNKSPTSIINENLSNNTSGNGDIWDNSNMNNRIAHGDRFIIFSPLDFLNCKTNSTNSGNSSSDTSVSL